MHTSVRKYKVDPEQMDELVRQVDETFAPRVEAMPGFVAYELLDCGYGIVLAITTCHDREAAERSVELAAEFVTTELEGIEIERVEATIGEVGVSRALAEMLEPTRA
jgi:Antibiotic biosynthesis monooxygenase